MSTVIVLGAGGPAGVNFSRAARQDGHRVVGLDSNQRALLLADADEAHVCPSVDTGLRNELLWFVQELLVWHPGAVVHAQPDPLVAWLSKHRHRFRDQYERPTARTMLPPDQTLRTCASKLATAKAWYVAELRTSEPVVIGDEIPDWLHQAKDRFGLPFWLRATHGAGARGATLVDTLETGFHWIRYWQTRGADHTWIAEEYLPGDEFCWTGVWQRGRLLAGFTRERLEWIYPHLAPSGRTGTPMAAVTVHDPDVSRVATLAVLAIDPEPHGVFCVDLVEDAAGVVRPTEINAGRFATTSPLYAPLGVNLVDLYLRAAAGEQVEPTGDDCYPAGRLLVRHIDCPAVLA